MKSIFRKVLGVILIVIGLAALLTPLTPGSWLALIGLELLGVHLLVFRRFLSDRQRAALTKFMNKFGLSPSDGSDDKSDKKQR
jgi:hypothetical protein